MKHKIALFIIFLLCGSTIVSAQLKDCNLYAFNEFHFRPNNASLTQMAKASLDSTVQLLENFTQCNIEVVGASCENCGKAWDRVLKVVNYLKSKGIDESRLKFRFECGILPETVKIKGSQNSLQ